MDASELRHYDGGSKRFEVIPCDPSWKDIQVYVLDGFYPMALPEEFVTNGENCDSDAPRNHSSGSIHYDITCYDLVDICNIQNRTIAMIGTDHDGNYRFVNENAYPVAGEFSNGEGCRKSCQTDQDCYRNYDEQTNRGAWCNPDKQECERCPVECFPGYVDFEFPPGNVEAGLCPSPWCCDFGMDGSEVRQQNDGPNYDGSEIIFDVLPCAVWNDIRVFVLDGIRREAAPEVFVAEGFECSSTSNQDHPSGSVLYQLYCSGFMKPYSGGLFGSGLKKLTVAMIGTDKDGILRIVNETAYPIAGQFSYENDSCAVQEVQSAILLMVGVLALTLCLCCCCCIWAINKSGIGDTDHDETDGGTDHDETDGGTDHDETDGGTDHDETDGGTDHDETDGGTDHDETDNPEPIERTESGGQK